MTDPKRVEIRILGSVGHCIHDPGDCAKCNQQNRCLSNETLTPEAKKTLEARLERLGREEES